MNRMRINPSRCLAAVATGATMLVAAVFSPLVAAEPLQDHEQESAMQRQEWLKERLDQTAERLEIRASQQNAWQSYAKTVEALSSGPGKEPGETADAVAIARFNADRAGEFAGKLKKIADATAKLQSALTPEQRKTFDQIVRLASHQRWGQHPCKDAMQGHDGAMMDHDHEHCEQRHDEHRNETPPTP